jgi:cellulose synthase/poly-beta-1,6-N-acetylglucosamine synthase-like glycosyltransferase
MIERVVVAVIWFFQVGILAFFLVMHFTNLLLILRAYFATRRYQDEMETDRFEGFFASAHSKPLSLICPAFNEEAGVVDSVNSLMGLHYPEFQVVVVNDGSVDGTLDKLIEAFHLRPSSRVVRQALPTKPIRGTYESASLPRLVVVDKENGGKADALNCGLNIARYPLVCCVDGDCIIENDALLRASRPFLDRPNVVATGGVIRPVNGCKVTPMGIRGIFLPKSWLARLQVVEYLRSFLFGRMGLSSMGSMFIVSGAFSVFRRDLALEIGGYRKTMGEDFEIVVRLHHHMRKQRRPYQIVMVPDPLCWTEVPEDVRSLRRQRNRWQRGLLDGLWMHREMWFNPEYGRVGMFSMPYFLFFEAVAPLVELFGYLFFIGALILGKAALDFALAFFVLALLLGISNSFVAIAMEQITNRPYPGLKDWGVLLWTAVLENFGFHQRTVWWRTVGIVDWLRGKQTWGEMKKTGAGGGAG